MGSNNSTIISGSGSLTPVFLADDGNKRATIVAGFAVNQLSTSPNGTFVTTDGTDIATFAGLTGVAGPLIVTEAPDVFASVTANSGTMNVTEHGDSWATSSGFARFELEGFTDTPDSGGFTTSGPDRILVRIQYGVAVVGAPSRLATVTDANGNTWQGECYTEAGSDTHSDNVRIEIWWAYSHKQVTGMPTTITIQPGGSSTTSAQFGFAVKGMNGNYNYPFDSGNNPYSYGGAIGGFFGVDAPVKAFFPYSDGPMEAATGVSPAFVSGNATGVAISGSPAVVLTSTGSGNPNNYASLDPSLSLIGGRKYFEVTFDNINGADYGAGFGYAPLATSTLLSAGAGGFIVRGNGHLFNGADVGNLGVTPANGDVIGIWLDLDNGLAYAKDITQGGNWNGDPTVNPLRSFGGINVAPALGSNLIKTGLFGQNTAPALIFGAPAGNSSAKMTFNFTPTPPLGTQLINGGFTVAASFPYPAINIMAMLSVTGSLFGILPTLSGFTADLLDDGVGSQRDMASSLQHRRLANNVPITDNAIFQDAGTAPTWAMLYDTIVPGAADPGSLESTEAADSAHLVGFPGAFGVVGDLLATDNPDTAIILGFEQDSGVLASTEATDTFSAFGFQPLTMTWHSTEAPDILTAAGIGRGENGIFVTTETTDTFAAIGHAPVSGTWASFEDTDHFTALGAGVTRVRRRRTLIVA